MVTLIPFLFIKRKDMLEVRTKIDGKKFLLKTKLKKKLRREKESEKEKKNLNFLYSLNEFHLYKQIP